VIHVLLLVGLASQPLPHWYSALPNLPGFESSFVQASGSAIFKSVTKEGRIQVAKGGRLRVTYEKGLSVISDGKTLVQFDPSTRTAQRLDINTAIKDAPMLGLLVNPSSLKEHFNAVIQGERVVLEPRTPGLSKVELEGRGATLRSVAWIDRTGAKQVLTLKDPVIRNAFPKSTFSIQVPEGTRWIH
jgi:outer membrane lipoprotein-sorting protein